jgi:uncharacterized OB-fold protein
MEYKLTFNTFRDALKEGKLLGLKCNQCGAYTIPPKKVCSECGSEYMEVVSLSGKGEIQTFTVIYVPPEGFEAPFVVAMVKLVEGPWVMGNVEGLNPDTVTMDIIGRRVTIGYKQLPADKISGGERMALTFSLAKSGKHSSASLNEKDDTQYVPSSLSPRRALPGETGVPGVFVVSFPLV